MVVGDLQQALSRNHVGGTAGAGVACAGVSQGCLGEKAGAGGGVVQGVLGHAEPCLLCVRAESVADWGSGLCGARVAIAG